MTATLALTVRALRAEVAALFTSAGIEHPYDEARDLIAAVLEQPRFWPATHGDDRIDGDDIRLAAVRRAQGMPFAYAVGKAAFRHLTLRVDERVLIPRQETELLVELALDATGGRGVIADVCTGSGCIALALATEGTFDRVIASDVSAAAIEIARANAALLAQPHAPIDFRVGDLLAPMRAGDGISAIVGNPPYIAVEELPELPTLVRDWEPPAALASGRDGLDHTMRIVDEAPRVLSSGGLLALEVDSRRAQRVALYVRAHAGYRHATVHNDFTGRERYVTAVAR